MSSHGNSNDNNQEHHIYEIYDREFKDVYKYGESGKPLTKDGNSPRGILQARELNRAVRWPRFLCRVIMTGISGKAEAKRIEQEFIDDYSALHGYVPPGNDTSETWAKE